MTSDALDELTQESVRVAAAGAGLLAGLVRLRVERERPGWSGQGPAAAAETGCQREGRPAGWRPAAPPIGH